MADNETTSNVAFNCALIVPYSYIYIHLRWSFKRSEKKSPPGNRWRLKSMNGHIHLKATKMWTHTDRPGLILCDCQTRHTAMSFPTIIIIILMKKES